MWVIGIIGVWLIILGFIIEFVGSVAKEVEVVDDDCFTPQQSLTLCQATSFNLLKAWSIKNLGQEPDMDKFLKGEYDETIEYIRVQKTLEKEAIRLENEPKQVMKGYFESSNKRKKVVNININTADGMPQFKN